MKNLNAKMLLGLSLLWTVSCATSTSSQSPSPDFLLQSENLVQEEVVSEVDIPFKPQHKATFPLVRDHDLNIIGVHYTWRECTKKFFGICQKWQQVEKIYKFSDQKVMNWFFSNDFVLKQRDAP